ncbi:MAG TPA: hypothetical protein V6D22_13730 [Candidatus Obscuribacterales bacterium]
MPKFRAIWHIDATGCSEVFYAENLKHAKKLVRDEDAGEWNRDEVETGDPIKLLEVIVIKEK